MLDRADRLHRRFFIHSASPGSPLSSPNWEPPLDIVETGGELRVDLALPGVRADSITLTGDADGLTVAATRAFPSRDPQARIQRIEIPYGRFERRLALDLERLELAHQAYADGVLTLTFRRKEGA